MYNETTLLEKLNNMGIEYKYVSHAPVFTSDAANEITPHLTGKHCKNLFVRDRTGRKWLLTIPDDMRADLKSVASIIGSHRLSFCNADELMECIGVTPGSVTPLAVINDVNNRVALYIDERIMNWDIIWCHPMVNTATIGIGRDDFQKFIQSTGHKLNVIRLAE